MQEEVWKDVVGYEGHYQVSNFGRVKSFKRYRQGKILRLSINTHGYLHVGLCKNNKYKWFRVHRLIAQAFIPNPENKPQVNHIDGNPLNNHVDNLEWVTDSENKQHAFSTGLNPSGENRSISKLTNDQVQYVRNNPDGLNTIQLAEKFGISQTAVSLIQLGKTYKNAGGQIRELKNIRVSEDVRKKIRAEYVPGKPGFSSRALAKKYGVGNSTILRIVKEI